MPVRGRRAGGGLKEGRGAKIKFASCMRSVEKKSDSKLLKVMKYSCRAREWEEGLGTLDVGQIGARSQGVELCTVGTHHPIEIPARVRDSTYSYMVPWIPTLCKR